jgi:hypothetical protein
MSCRDRGGENRPQKSALAGVRRGVFFFCLRLFRAPTNTPAATAPPLQDRASPARLPTYISRPSNPRCAPMRALACLRLSLLAGRCLQKLASPAAPKDHIQNHSRRTGCSIALEKLLYSTGKDPLALEKLRSARCNSRRTAHQLRYSGRTNDALPTHRRLSWHAYSCTTAGPDGLL